MEKRRVFDTREGGVFALAGMRLNFDRPALPWYGRGNFPLSPR
jgi:hypothetical protein